MHNGRVASGWRHGARVLAVAAAGCAGAGEPTVDFAPSVPRIQVDGGPYWMEAGDVDGDGDTDFAVMVFFNTASVSFLLNDGRGGFEVSAESLPVGFTANGGDRLSYPTFGDLDGDGDPDLVFPEPGGEPAVRVMLNDGTGAFTPGALLEMDADPMRIAIGDLDGDGANDLAVTSFTGGTLDLFYGDGAGSYERATPIDVGTRVGLVLLEDFWGDGGLDIVVNWSFSGNAYIWAYKNLGGRAFAPPVENWVLWIIEDIAPIDVDGDGDLDLAVAEWDVADLGPGEEGGAGARGLPISRLRIVENRLAGNGTLWPGDTESLGVWGPGYSVAVSDHDGDGAPDIAIAAYSRPGRNDGLVLFRNTGDGFTSDDAPETATELARFVAAADLDGDGDDELAVATRSPDFSVRGWDNEISLLGNDGGSFSNEPRFGVGVGAPRFSVAGDFDGDGDDDLAVVDTFADGIAVLSGDGDGGFEVSQRPSEQGGWQHIVRTDLENDGDLDFVAVSGNSPGVVAFVNDGTGVFTGVGVGAAGVAPRSLATGDLNGDGFDDLIVVANNVGSGLVSLLLNDGSGGFGAPGTIATGASPMWAVAEDLNGDGDTDVAVVFEATRRVAIYLGDGEGGLTLSQDLETAAMPNGLAVGDFDGDGAPELAVACRVDDPTDRENVLVFAPDLGGTFALRHSLVVGGASSLVIAEDVNRDGFDDLVVTSEESMVSVLLSRGADGFRDELRWFVGGDAAGVTALDANSDGHTDLLVATPDDGRVSLLLNRPVRCNDADLAEPFGVLDLADVVTFVSAFLAGGAAADLAPPQGVLDLADLAVFVERFVGGCP